ncbi:MAG: ATP-binding protein [Chloroflexota bacterium]
MMNYKVLMIDDEQASYEFVQDMLAYQPGGEFEVTWVAEFEEAIEHVFSDAYDVCLLDYNLGGFTGVEFLKHVLEKGSRLPFILLTGQGSQEIDLSALRAGAAEYLDKSTLKPAVVARTIRYAVRQQRDKNELADLYRQVSELEQLKTDMIRIAAHDLRTPLMTVLNYAQFLQKDTDHPLQDYQQGYAEEIVSGVRRMQQIISDILSLERIQETPEDRYQDTVDLLEIVQSATGTAAPPDRDLTITQDLINGPVMVRGDAAQLREASTNLFHNAIKYTPDGGSIHITLGVHGDEVLFAVADTGYGIPDDMQERLFQPFYRAKSKETRRIAGTGLGLHLVRNIIRRHRGDVFFESIYREGSTFGYRLPVAAE